MARWKREDWLREGLKVLIEGEGEKGLKIDKMCQRLEVTKGSFYHHFQNRSAFVLAILGYWEERYTEQFIAHSEQGGTVLQKLERLLSLVVETFGAQERKLRAWGQSEPLAAAVMARVDQRRLSYLYELCVTLLEDEERGQRLAQLLYVTLIGTESLSPLFDKDDLQGMFTYLVGTVKTGPLASKEEERGDGSDR